MLQNRYTMIEIVTLESVRSPWRPIGGLPNASQQLVIIIEEQEKQKSKKIPLTLASGSHV